MLTLSWAFLIYTPAILVPVEEKKASVSTEIVENITVSTYNPVEGQTDDTPFQTADMSCIRPGNLVKDRWCAISPDLFHRFGGTLKFGDTIVIHYSGDKRDQIVNEFEGKWVVHDLTNFRLKHTVDLLYASTRLGYYTDFNIVKIRRGIAQGIE